MKRGKEQEELEQEEGGRGDRANDKVESKMVS